MVTIQMLKQYPSIKKEVCYLEKQMGKLENEKVQIESCMEHDTVKGSSKEFPFIEQTFHIGGIKEISKSYRLFSINEELEVIKKRYDDICKESREIIGFIGSIEDSYIRMIMTYRVIEGYSWQKVANEMGGKNTADGVRKAYMRYMEHQTH